MKKITLFSLIYAFLISMVFGQTRIALTPVELDIPTNEMTAFLDYDLVSFDHEPLFQQWQAGAEQLDIQLTTPAKNLRFAVAQHDLRSPGYHLTTGSRADGTYLEFPRRAATLYRGQRLEAGTDSGSKAFFTVEADFLLGHWSENNEGVYLEPLWRFYAAAPRDVYVLYRTSQVEPHLGECSVVEPETRTELPMGAEGFVGECIEVEIAIATDFELFQALGSANAVESFYTNLLALTQTNYDSELGDEEFEDALIFTISDMYIATSNGTDPWTNSTDASDLLPNFRNWGNGPNSFGNSYDVASLWSGRDFDNPTLGVAYLGGLCTSFRYNILENFGLSTAGLRTVWSHELGHNFDAPHVDENTIMRAFLLLTNDWANQTRNTINNFYQSANCLTNCPQSAPATSFTVSETNICPGSMVGFSNATAGTVSSFSWSFPGGNPSTSTEENPVVTYNNIGNYTATLTATNSAGSSSSQSTILVLNGGNEIIINATFEGEGPFGIIVDNPDNDDTWQLGGGSGNGGSVAAAIDNFNDDFRGQEDALVLPTVDLTTSSSLRLQFEYAYARYNANFRDQLEVRVNTPGGQTTVFAGDEDGSMNFATAPDQTSIFIPDAASDWCFSGPTCIDLDLSQFDGENSVQVSIVNISGYGNVMWVDNIELTSICAPPVLPVEWLTFTTTAKQYAAELEWTVNQDESHAGFYVERQVVDESARPEWVDLDFVAARGGSASGIAYRFEDRSVMPGSTYLYRLRQLDLDGTEDRSIIRTVSFESSKGGPLVFPNPTTNEINLISESGSGNYQLLDLSGRLLLHGPLNGSRTVLDLTELPTGTYWLRSIAEDGSSEAVRVVKQ
jgi:PKD repeat protein